MNTNYILSSAYRFCVESLFHGVVFGVSSKLAIIMLRKRELVTVISEIFARVLFSRNFAYAKFRENNILTNWRNHSVVY